MNLKKIDFSILKKRLRVSSALLKLTLVVLIGSAGFLSAKTIPAGERPNIIFILADDLGYADLGYKGSPIKTPTLDRLRHEGMELTNFIVQPQCSPSRTAFLSGQYPYRTAMHSEVVLAFAEYGMPGSTVTIAEALKQQDYKTALIGKWHVGHHLESMLPEHQGFDYFFGCYQGSLDYFNHKFPKTAHNLHRNREPVHVEGYATDLFADDAVKLIQTHDQKNPLFLYLAFNAPHHPLQAKKEDLEKYKDAPNKDLQTYRAMVDSMDQGIGRVVDALTQAKMIENTLIVFASDNGGFDQVITNNKPFRGNKGQTYEGGIHVPGIAYWPRHIKPNSTNDSLVYIADLYPTFVSLAQGDLANYPQLDGVDMRPIFEGKPGNRQEVAVISNLWQGLRVKDWILIANKTSESFLKGKGKPLELYNLKEDIGEQKNVIAEHPEIAKELMEKLKLRCKEVPPSQFDFKQAQGVEPEDWGKAVVNDLKP